MSSTTLSRNTTIATAYHHGIPTNMYFSFQRTSKLYGTNKNSAVYIAIATIHNNTANPTIFMCISFLATRYTTFLHVLHINLFPCCLSIVGFLQCGQYPGTKRNLSDGLFPIYLCSFVTLTKYFSFFVCSTCLSHKSVLLPLVVKIRFFAFL